MDKFQFPPPLEQLEQSELQHLIDFLNRLLVKIYDKAIPRYVVKCSDGSLRRIYDITVQATIDSIQTEISAIYKTQARITSKSKTTCKILHT